jgi:hypothetical protein
VIHFIAVGVHWWVWLIIVLCKLEWWLLHYRPFIAAGCVYDVIKYTGWPLLRRAWWMHTMPEPAGE